MKKSSSVCATWVPKREEVENDVEAIPEEITTDHLKNWMNEIEPQISSHRFKKHKPKQMNTKKTTPRNITIKPEIRGPRENLHYKRASFT